MSPFLAVLVPMQSHAKNVVLLSSLNSVSVELTPLESLFLNLWTSFIDPQNGCKRVKATMIKSGPLSPLRIPLALTFKGMQQSGPLANHGKDHFDQLAKDLMPKIRVKTSGIPIKNK